VVAIDTEGTIYCLAEYYQPGLTPRQHMEYLELLPGFLDARPIYADPSIFYRTQAQSDGGFKSIDVSIAKQVSEVCRKDKMPRFPAWSGFSSTGGISITASRL
jgi:hypothetical protein